MVPVLVLVIVACTLVGLYAVALADHIERRA